MPILERSLFWNVSVHSYFDLNIFVAVTFSFHVCHSTGRTETVSRPSWFRVQGSRFKVHGSWFMVHGSGFRAHPEGPGSGPGSGSGSGFGQSGFQNVSCYACPQLEAALYVSLPVSGIHLGITELST